jgi:hypothetical protein
MSHADKADKLLIKPAAGPRPASPHHSNGSFARHATRPVTRRATSNTTTTRLATASDRPTQPSLTVPRRSGRRGAVDQFEDACRCYPRELPLPEVAEFEFFEDFAFEERLGGVRDEYLPRLGRVAEQGNAGR